jgi:hypothetical protein
VLKAGVPVRPGIYGIWSPFEFVIERTKRLHDGELNLAILVVKSL